jgi:hypothetical protein
VAAWALWALWALTMLGLAAVPWLDRLLRQAGRADLVQLTPDTAPPMLAIVSAATVGAVLASRRPRHPVGLAANGPRPVAHRHGGGAVSDLVAAPVGLLLVVTLAPGR